MVDAVGGAFVKKDYGGRFKPLQRSDATEFHFLSIRGENTTFASLIKYLFQDTFRRLRRHTGKFSFILQVACAPRECNYRLQG